MSHTREEFRRYQRLLVVDCWAGLGYELPDVKFDSLIGVFERLLVHFELLDCQVCLLVQLWILA